MNEVMYCPCCGASAGILIDCKPNDFYRFVAICNNLDCKLQTPPHFTQESAMKAWNNRIE
jgi:hypothetical protein